VRPTKKATLLGLLLVSLLLFAGGMLAFFLQRNQTICPNGKPPVASRSAVLEPTEYRCSDGVVVTKG
jgi:hypothetical protein